MDGPDEAEKGSDGKTVVKKAPAGNLQLTTASNYFPSQTGIPRRQPKNRHLHGRPLAPPESHSGRDRGH